MIFSKIPSFLLVFFLYFALLGLVCVRNGGSVDVQWDQVTLTFSGQSKAQ